MSQSAVSDLESQSAGSSGEHPELEALLPARLHLPVKFHLVSASRKESNPLGWCPMDPDSHYLITKMERIDRCVVVHLMCPLNDNFSLPKQHDDVVSDEDILAINERTHRIVLIKLRRPNMSDVFDLIIK
jgi:hypothetical protein